MLLCYYTWFHPLFDLLKANYIINIKKADFMRFSKIAVKMFATGFASGTSAFLTL